jgi:hypothetical protein
MQDGALLDPPVTVPRGTTEDQVAHRRRRRRHRGTARPPGKITLVNVANTAGLDGGADNRFQATATPAP